MTYDEYDAIMKNILDLGSQQYAGMHFFKYVDHANSFISDLGQMIVMCDIPDELIKEFDYVSFRRRRFSVAVPIPEYIIDKNYFDKDFIVEINPSLRFTEMINGRRNGKIYNSFLKDMYNEFIRTNGYFFETPYVFYDYVKDFFKDKDLDEVINLYACSNITKKLIRR